MTNWKHLWERMKDFYFPKHGLSPSFTHGMLGFFGAAIGAKGAAFYGFSTPLIILLFSIAAYLAVSTMFGAAMKLIGSAL